MITQLTPKQLRRAADLQETILKLQDELTEILGAAETPAETPEPRKKYKFSAAARAKMRKAQKERWAKIKGETATEAPAKAEKKPRKMVSAAVRKARSERMKAMWAARRMGKVAKTAPAKAEKKGKRKLSAAARVAMAAAAKARWAKAKAAGKKSL